MQQEVIHKQIGSTDELVRTEQDDFARRKEQRMIGLGIWRGPALSDTATRPQENEKTHEERSTVAAGEPPVDAEAAVAAAVATQSSLPAPAVAAVRARQTSS